MKIIKGGRYRIISCDGDGLIHEWNLHIAPEKRAWKLVNREVNVGDILHGYTVLKIEKTQHTTQNALSTNVNLFFNRSYAVNSYRCDICGGTVIHDRCTECQFDWDS